MSLNNILLHNDIIESFKSDDWENVLKVQSVLNESYFLWPKPQKCDLEFIANSVKEINLTKIVSIGCGTGLLEWLLKVATGLNVVGLEVDQNYWKSRHARASFIDLIFPQEECFLKVIEDEKSALLFCYFNNGKAFQNYLNIYPGRCIVIIGPHNSGRHTDPRPFDESIPSDWTLWRSKEISRTGDYIAIYLRSSY